MQSHNSFSRLSGQSRVLIIAFFLTVSIISAFAISFIDPPRNPHMSEAKTAVYADTATQLFYNKFYLLAELRMDDGSVIKGQPVSFYIDGEPNGTAMTDQNGQARLPLSSLASFEAAEAKFGGDGYLNPSSGSINISLNVPFFDDGTEKPAGKVEINGEIYEQFPAEIGKPVKWRITKNTGEISPSYRFSVPEDAQNVTVKYLGQPVSGSPEVDVSEIGPMTWENLFATAAEKQVITAEFFTPAPYSTESDTGMTRKIIVKSDASIHYYNVTAYTELPDMQIRPAIYRIINGTRVEITRDPRYRPTYIDFDQDGRFDRLEWMVPQLSEDGYEVDLFILNVKSNPELGGNWTVQFTTVGAADLTITPIEETTWSPDGAGTDLRFSELLCNNQPVSHQWVNGSVLAQNWSCTGTAKEISFALTEGYHALNFSFGPLWAKAENFVGTPGLIVFWNNTEASMPAGWSCLSCGSGDFYQKLVEVTGSYADGGGSATHTVTTSGGTSSTSSTQTFGGCIDFCTTPTPSHTHTVTPTSPSTSGNSLPAYQNIRVMRYNRGVPGMLPPGVIAMFNRSNIPPNWSFYTPMYSSFPRGENDQSTDTTETHTHQETVPSQSHTSAAEDCQNDFANTGHDPSSFPHSSSTATSGSGNEQPAYRELVFAFLHDTVPPPHAMFALFNATPPSVLECPSCTGGRFNANFIRGNSTSTPESTGGAATHTHSDPTATLADTGSFAVCNAGGGSIAHRDHTHTVTITFGDGNNDPPSQNAFLGVFFDLARPKWSNAQINETEPVNKNKMVRHSAYWNDSNITGNSGLYGYIFSYNGSLSSGCGTWVNDSVVFFSGDNGTYEAWSNTSKPAECSGNNVGWKIYVNDSRGNVNITGLQIYYINADPSPVLVSPVDKANVSDSTPEFIYEITDPDTQTLTSILVIDNGTIIVIADNITAGPRTAYQVKNSSNLTLADGSYTWWVNITDGFFENQSAKRTIVIDTVSPRVTNVKTNVSLLRSSSLMSLNATVTDPTSGIRNVSAGVSLNNRRLFLIPGSDNWTVNSTPANLGCTANSESSCTITVNASDYAGNQNTSETVAITIDDLEPRVTITSPTNNTFGAVINFNATVTDARIANGTLQVTPDGQSPVNYTLTNYSGNWGYTNGSMPDNTYHARFFLNDTLGNENATQNVVFTVDTVAPTKPFYAGPSPAAGANVSWNFIPVNVTFTEKNPSNCIFAIDGTNTTRTDVNSTGAVNERFCFFNSTGMALGIHTIVVYANDSASNVVASDNRTIVLDTVEPTIDFVTPTPANDANVSASFAFVNTTTNDTLLNLSGFIDWNTSLVMYLRFNEDRGSYANDTSTFGNNGTLYNFSCTTLDCNATSGRTTGGKFGRGLVFDGIGNYINISDSPTLDISGNLTIEGWVSIGNNETSSHIIVSKYSSSDRAYMLLYNTTQKAFVFIVTNSAGVDDAALNTSTETAKNEWHHIAAVYSYSPLSMILYVDALNRSGTLLGTVPAQIRNSAQPLQIGVYSDASFPLNGTADEIRIWNRSLSEAEINASFNSGRGRLQNNFTSLADGTYRYYAYVSDNAGNTNRTPASGYRTVNLDTVRPGVFNPAVNRTTPIGTSQMVTINVTANDTFTGVRTVNAGVNINNVSLANSIGQSWNVSASPQQLGCSADVEGTCTITFNATDFAGNTNATETLVINVDTRPPRVNITSPANRSVSNSVVNFNATVLEPNAGTGIVQVTPDGQSPVNYTLTNYSGNWGYTNGSVPDNTYHARFFLTDSGGNVNATQTIVFTIDTTAPASVTFVSPTPVANANLSQTYIDINVTFTELYPNNCIFAVDSTNTSKTDVNATGAANQRFCSFNAAGLSDGAHTIMVYANDTAGNIGVSANRTITLDTVIPNVTAQLANKTGVLRISEVISINVTANDTTSGVRTVNVGRNTNNISMANFIGYNWTGNATPQQFGCPTGVDGNCTLTFNASDHAGNANTTVAFNITVDGGAPLMHTNFTDPSSPATWASGVTYYFNITLTDLGAGVEEATFEFNGVNKTLSGGGVRRLTGNANNGTYTANVSNLNANESGWSYRWYANDTFGNANATASLRYIINKAASEIRLLANGTRINTTALGVVGYVNATTANFSAVLITPSGTTNTLEIWWTFPTTLNRAAQGANMLIYEPFLNVTGIFNITANWTGNENYSADDEKGRFSVGPPTARIPQAFTSDLANRDLLEPGEAVRIRVNITHPAGKEFLDTIHVNLTHPNGSRYVTNGIMVNVTNITQELEEGYIYEYNYTRLGETFSYNGTWAINVSVNDTSGQIDRNSSNFDVVQEHIIFRQFAEIQWFNNTHINITLTVFVRNNASRTIRNLTVTPYSNFSDPYYILNFAPGATDERSFTKTFLRPSTADEPFNVSTATSTRGSGGQSNAIKFINPIDPACKGQINVTLDTRPANPSENIRPTFNGTARHGDAQCAARTVRSVLYQLDARANVSAGCQDGSCNENNEEFNLTLTRAELETKGLLGNHTIIIWVNNSNGDLGNVTYNFAVVDLTPPNYSNVAATNTSILQKDTVNLTAQAYDLVNLSHAVLSTNETGQWANKSGVYGSPLAMYTAETLNWTNFTWRNTTFYGMLGWRIWYNDTSGNINGTPINDVYVQQIIMNVSLSVPSNTTVTGNRTFTVNATMICIYGDCGNVSGTVRYNSSSANPDTAVNTTQGATPFWVQTGSNPQNCSTNPIGNSESCTLSWKLNASGGTGTTWKIGVLFQSNDTDIVSNHTSNSTTTIVDCTLALTLQWDDINFGEFFPNTQDVPAPNNNNGGYNVTVEQDSCNLDIYVKSTDLRHNETTNYIIEPTNITFNTSAYAPLRTFSRNYVQMNNDTQWGTNLTTYYWIDVPRGILFGNYSGNVTYLGNRTPGR